jgi:hypothetical protein
VIPARIPRTIGWIALAAGTALSIASLAILVRTWMWHGATATSIGTVTAHRAAVSSSRDPSRTGARRQLGRTLAEVVRFADADGTEHGFTSPVSVSHPFAIGDAIPVRYTPASPGDAVVDTWFRLWGLGTIFTGAGVVLCGFGAVFLRIGRVS